MRNFIKGTLILTTVAALLVVAVALTPSAPSAVIHEKLEHNHQLMMTKAQDVVDQLESRTEKTELDSTFFRHPDALWRITALKGEELTMVHVTVDDSNTNYKLSLSVDKAKLQKASYTSYSKFKH